MALKQTLKQSEFIVACARVVRAAASDVRHLRWVLRRRGVIEKYLAEHPVRKLQIGSSLTPFAGWLNTDLEPGRADVVYLDATKPFPLPDASFDYIAGEHMIEHIDHASGLAMLRECHRVLKPGGKIRLVTPDLQIMASLATPTPTPAQREYIDWIIGRTMPEVDANRGVFVVNNAFRAWGHQFLYDAATLKRTLERTGFADCREFKPGESDDPNLRGIESHGQAVGNEAMNRYESLVIEARKS
jgi:predicted SAM-dependent methyltransferase